MSNWEWEYFFKDEYFHKMLILFYYSHDCYKSKSVHVSVSPLIEGGHSGESLGRSHLATPATGSHERHHTHQNVLSIWGLCSEGTPRVSVAHTLLTIIRRSRTQRRFLDQLGLECPATLIVADSLQIRLQEVLWQWPTIPNVSVSRGPHRDSDQWPCVRGSHRNSRDLRPSSSTWQSKQGHVVCEGVAIVCLVDDLQVRCLRISQLTLVCASHANVDPRVLATCAVGCSEDPRGAHQGSSANRSLTVGKYFGQMGLPRDLSTLSSYSVVDGGVDGVVVPGTIFGKDCRLPGINCSWLREWDRVKKEWRRSDRWYLQETSRRLSLEHQPDPEGRQREQRCWLRVPSYQTDAFPNRSRYFIAIKLATKYCVPITHQNISKIKNPSSTPLSGQFGSVLLR